MHYTGHLPLKHLAVALLISAPLASAGQLQATLSNRGGQPLADVVVYLLPQKNAPLPAPRPATIDQQNRSFVPAVSVVQTGTAVSFPNSDNIRHQVYSFSPAKTFNLKLYSGRPAEPVVFDKAGTVVLGCNIHDQMVAWVLVVDSPWFSKSDSAGKVVLDVPDGTYQLKWWHPRQREEAAALNIEIKGTVNQNLSLDAAPLGVMAHGAGH